MELPDLFWHKHFPIFLAILTLVAIIVSILGTYQVVNDVATLRICACQDQQKKSNRSVLDTVMST
jgi:hypothetical protein|uniref:Uncharacterized protein n=1 Tax=viral metagenome TaxID=1070528 RepID=A0A6C0IZ01_9ZZZZ